MPRLLQEQKSPWLTGPHETVRMFRPSGSVGRPLSPIGALVRIPKASGRLKATGGRLKSGQFRRGTHEKHKYIEDSFNPTTSRGSLSGEAMVRIHNPPPNYSRWLNQVESWSPKFNAILSLVESSLSAGISASMLGPGACRAAKSHC
jgi:hypothetical protein